MGRGLLEMTQFVYLVRPGEANRQLKYSLRSLERNAADSEIIIAGYKPRWVKGVEHIPVPQPVQHHRNQVKILKEVVKAELPRGENFILMNDDFFALQPIKSEPELIYSGTLDDLAERPAWRSGFYGESLENTKNILYRKGIQSNLAFDGVHRPMPLNQVVLGEVLKAAGDTDVQHRSLYGNVVHERGLAPWTPATEGSDAKIRVPRKRLPDGDWISSSRLAWGSTVQRLIHALYPNKSRYEV